MALAAIPRAKKAKLAPGAAAGIRGHAASRCSLMPSLNLRGDWDPLACRVCSLTDSSPDAPRLQGYSRNVGKGWILGGRALPGASDCSPCFFLNMFCKEETCSCCHREPCACTNVPLCPRCWEGASDLGACACKKGAGCKCVGPLCLGPNEHCEEYGQWCGGPWSCSAPEDECNQCQAYRELDSSWVELAAEHTEEGRLEVPVAARRIYPKVREGPWLKRVMPAVVFAPDVVSILAFPCDVCKLDLLQCRCLPSACGGCRLTRCVCQPSSRCPRVCSTCLCFADHCECRCQCRAPNRTTCSCLFRRACDGKCESDGKGGAPDCVSCLEAKRFGATWMTSFLRVRNRWPEINGDRPTLFISDSQPNRLAWLVALEHAARLEDTFFGPKVIQPLASSSSSSSGVQVRSSSSASSSCSSSGAVSSEKAMPTVEVEYALKLHEENPPALLDGAATSIFLRPESMDRYREDSETRADHQTVVYTASEAGPVMRSRGRLEVSLPLASGHFLRLDNAAILPGLRQDLYSEGSLTDSGYMIAKVLGWCFIVDENGVLVLVVPKVNNIYPIPVIGSQAVPISVGHRAIASQIVEGTAALLAHASAASCPKKPFQAWVKVRALTLADGVSSPASLSQESSRESKQPSESALQPSLPCVKGSLEDDHMAALTRSFMGPNLFRLTLHKRLQHRGLKDPSSWLFRQMVAVYGNRFLKAPDYFCEGCYENRTHVVPHPRRPADVKQAREGYGRLGVVSFDLLTWPFPNERGNRNVTVMCTKGVIEVFDHGPNLKGMAPELLTQRLELVLKRLDAGPITLGPL